MFLLTGKTLKGKNRIRENGERWLLIRQHDKVLFSNEPGPWLLIESVKTNHVRWVHKTNDVNFEVKEVQS